MNRTPLLTLEQGLFPDLGFVMLGGVAILLFVCPQCGRKVNVWSEICRFCGRQSTDPITRLKAERARIDADWEREGLVLLRECSAWEYRRKKCVLVGGGVAVALALLVIVPVWLGPILHRVLDLLE